MKEVGVKVNRTCWSSKLGEFCATALEPQLSALRHGRAASTPRPTPGTLNALTTSTLQILHSVSTSLLCQRTIELLRPRVPFNFGLEIILLAFSSSTEATLFP